MKVALLLFLSLASQDIRFCPRINMINIDLGESIDKGVLKRTRKHCSRLYSKSPCLVKLEQVKKGAFQATCGERIAILSPEVDIDLSTDEEMAINCSAAIFASFPDDKLGRETSDFLKNPAFLFCQNAYFPR